jgi:hypothetical protein
MAASCDSNLALVLALNDVAKVRWFSLMGREPQPLRIQVQIVRELECYLCCHGSV